MPDATTQRVRILTAILERLQAIRAGEEAPEGNGTFLTSVGDAVHLGVEPKLSKDDPDALVIAIGDDVPEVPGQQLKALIDVPVEIQALAAADLDQPWLTVEALLGDIKRALELRDRQFGGLLRTFTRGPSRTLPREPGSTSVGVGITYQVGYSEVWGKP